MAKYRVIYEDPDRPEEAARVLVPSDGWLKEAMSGNLPPIWVYWQLQSDEEKAISEGRHNNFRHDPKKLALQDTAPRIGPLTEEEAMEYLVMKDVPRRVWAVEHNRPMFKIVKTEQIPSDRTWRNSWKLAV
jgi:hypothetical protein